MISSPHKSVGQRLAEPEAGRKDHVTTGVPAFDYTKAVQGVLRYAWVSSLEC